MSYPEIKDYSEIKAILKRDAEDVRNWRYARERLPEILDFVEAKERALADTEQRNRDLQASISRLSGEETNLRGSIATLQKQLSGLKDTLAVRERGKAERLAALDAEILAKEAKLAEVEAKLETFKSRLNL